MSRCRLQHPRTPLLAGHVLALGLVLATASVPRPSSAAATQIEATSRTLELRGAGPDEVFGRPLLCVDLDVDGCDDIVVGADKFHFSGDERPALFIFRGSPAYRLGGLIDLARHSPSAVVLGDAGSDNLATALAAGDVNGDGAPDLVMADPSISPQGRTAAGAAYVLLGRRDFFDQTVYDLAAGQWFWMLEGAAAGDDLGGSNLFGGLQSHGLACGDLNGDHFDDIAVGAHLGTASGRARAGKIHIVFGTDARGPGSRIDLLTQSSVVILGPQAENELGTALAVGNVNGDLYMDLLAGQPLWSASTFSSEGMAHLFLGKAAWPSAINLASVNADLRVRGAAAGDELGEAVAVTDVNADGRGEMILTAGGWTPPDQTREAGAAYGIFGSASPAGLINLATTPPGFFVEGIDINNDVGRALAAGDFNADGAGDFFLTARDGERPGHNAEGRAFVIFGSQFDFPALFRLAQDEANLIINGGVDNLQLGDTIAAGDVDGDGADELLLAAPFVASNTGRVLVFDLNLTALDDILWMAK
ncbi:MAG: hypothetical protein Kow0059_01650 [Candidatus Sumerlaeia bacterium]